MLIEEMAVPAKRAPGTRFLTVLLVLGFLTHAGNGLVAASCHVQLEDDLVTTVLADVDQQEHHHHDTAGDPDASGSHHSHSGPEEGGACPLGGGALALCSGSPPVPSLLAASVPTPIPSGTVAFALPDDEAGALLALNQFRPPRG
jgi:hypothetical protein